MVETHPRDRWSTPPHIVRLWMGVLLAPAAWAMHFTISYALSGFACAPPQSWGLHLSTVVAAIIALGGGYLGWAVRRETAEEPEGASDSMARGRFMATAGVVMSALFLLVILAQAIPLLLLEPCR